jgi:hypothetical protein
MAGFLRVLESFAEWREKNRPGIAIATVAVTERYARRKLRIRKREPLQYRGLTLKCIGSKLWRDRQVNA